MADLSAKAIAASQSAEARKVGCATADVDGLSARAWSIGKDACIPLRRSEFKSRSRSKTIHVAASHERLRVTKRVQ